MKLKPVYAPSLSNMMLILQENRFFLFLVIGFINTLFSYCIFSLLIFFGFHYTIAVLLATLLGILFNFQTTGRIVFNNADIKLLLKFFLVYLIVYFMNIYLIKFFIFLRLNVFLAGAVAIPFVAVSSFLLNKTFVFKKTKTLCPLK